MSSVRRALSRSSKFFSRRRKAAAGARNLFQAERLELRQLMAGDVNQFHNPWYAQDVNNDYVATPLDALMVINALNTGGSRQLVSPTASGAQGEEMTQAYLDVDGDGYLTPSDALGIINHLNANGEAPIAVRVRTVLYGENGREITTGRTGSGTLADPYVYTLSKDDRYGVSVQQTDLRPVPFTPPETNFGPTAQGVWALFTDVAFDPTKTALGFSEIQQFTSKDIDTNDAQASITITVAGLGTTDPILLNQPGVINETSFDLNANANAIRLALNKLSGGTLNDVFRVTAAEAPTFDGTVIYNIKFLGDFVNRDVDLISVAGVPADGPITLGTPTTVYAPVTGGVLNVNKDVKANIEMATNLQSRLFQFLDDSTGGPRVADQYRDTTDTGNANLEALGRVGGYGYLDGTTPNVNGKTSYSPNAFGNGTYIEMIRPYFVATNPTTAQNPLTITVNPAGTYTNDPQNDTFTKTLILGPPAPEPGLPVNVNAGVVPKESVDYGAPIKIIIRADVTAAADTATVAEDVIDAPISVLGNDTNNLNAAGPKLITGVGADGKQTSYTVAGEGTVTWDGTNIKFTPVTNFFGTFTFQYGLTDTGVDPKDIGTVTVTITPSNDPPTAGNDNVTVVEDSGANIITGSLLSNDTSAPDALGSETLKVVAINGVASATTGKATVAVDANGVVTYTPNNNASGSDTFTYTLSDGNGGQTNATVTVTITAVNDAPSFTVAANHTSTEDGGAQSQDNFITAINPGAANANPLETDGPVTFTVTPLTVPATLTFTTPPAIDNNGRLTYQAAPEAYGSATYTVVGRDANNASTSTTFTITVNAVDDAPTFTIPTTFTSNEDINVTQVGFASGVTPGPNETGSVTFAVSVLGTTGNLAFAQAPAIVQVGTNGTLTFNPATDTFGTATIQVIASDGAVQSTPQTFTLTVNNVNDAPDAIDDTNLEAPDGDTTNLTVVANDLIAPDVGETLIIDTSSPLVFVSSTIAGGVTVAPASDGVGLDITTSLGVVKVTVAANGTSLDVTSPLGLINGNVLVQYKIRDRAAGDASGLTDTAIATINFVSNELPRAIPETITNVVAEGSDFTPLSVLSNDRRADVINGALTITGIRFLASDTLVTTTGTIITDVNGNQLRIAADRLSVEFKPGPNVYGNVSFNYEVNETPATADGPSETTSVVVVTPVNDEPTFTVGGNVAVLEDSGANSQAWATAISAGPNESGQVVVFTTSNDNNSLFLVQPTIAADGTLSFTPAGNANGTAIVSVYLSDNGGTALGGDDTSPTQTFTITVTSVNDAPTFVLGANPSVAEDSGAASVSIANTISAGPSDEGLQGLSFTVENNTNTALFSVQPQVASNGTLTFTPADNAFGTAQITLRLTDTGGIVNGGVNFTEQTFTITVTPVNDTPTFTVGPNLVDNEDAGAQTEGTFIGSFSAGPANETTGPNAQQVSFTVTNNNNGLFSVQPAISPTGALTYTPATNANGNAIVTVIIRDDNGTPGNTADDAVSAAQTFTITIEAVNDVPSFTKGSNVTVAEDLASYNAAFATAISKGPADESGQELTFHVSNDNSTLFLTQPTIDPVTGNLNFVPAADANGTAIVTVTLSDDGGTARGGVDTSAQQTFTITITPVNDAPSFTLIPAKNQTVNEDAGTQSVSPFAQNISAGPANESSQTVAFTVSNNNTALFSVQPAIAADGTLTYRPADNANGTATVTVLLRDDNGTPGNTTDDGVSASQTFTISVTAVNDPPTANDDPAVRVFKTLTSVDLTNLLANDTSTPDGAETLTIVGVVITSAAPGDAGSPANTNLTATVINGGTGVRFNNPDGFYGDVVLTYTIQDPGGLTDTATVTLNVVNFLPGYISGVVWVDVDNDSVVDLANPPLGAERRIGGVEVYLYGQTMFGQSFSQVVTTNVNGEYRFDDSSLPNGGIIPGNYTVSLDNPNTPAVEGVDLFSDGNDVNGQVSGQGATSNRIANNTFQIVFNENGATIANLNFAVLGLQSNFVNIRDHLASSTTNGVLFGANLGAATLDSQQYWATMYDSWGGMHDMKIKIAPDLSTATIEGRDTNNVLYTKTLSFANDYTKIRIMGRDGNNIVVRLIGTASDFFPNADLVAGNSLPGPQGEVMYANGEGAEFAAAADAVYAEETWA